MLTLKPAEWKMWMPRHPWLKAGGETGWTHHQYWRTNPDCFCLVCLDAWTLAAAAACREPALAVRLPRYCLRPRCPIPVA